MKIISTICVLACVSILLSGCAGHEEGTVILTQDVNLSPLQHDEINKNYSNLVDIQDDVTRKYNIGSFTQKYVLKKTQRLGNTIPRFNYLLDVTGAQINLNYALFTSNLKESDDNEAVLGLIAHELAHAQHYLYFSLFELLQLGLRYESYEIKFANSQWATWVRSYERFTDIQAIAYGYADALIKQKEKTLQYIQSIKNSKEKDNTHQLYEFSAYLNENEIMSLNQDRQLLKKQLQKELDILEWDVFKRIAKDFPDTHDAESGKR